MTAQELQQSPAFWMARCEQQLQYIKMYSLAYDQHTRPDKAEVLHSAVEIYSYCVGMLTITQLLNFNQQPLSA